MRLDVDATGADTLQYYEGNSPRHWARLESHLDVVRGSRGTPTVPSSTALSRTNPIHAACRYPVHLESQ